MPRNQQKFKVNVLEQYTFIMIVKNVNKLAIYVYHLSMQVAFIITVSFLGLYISTISAIAILEPNIKARIPAITTKTFL